MRQPQPSGMHDPLLKGILPVSRRGRGLAACQTNLRPTALLVSAKLTGKLGLRSSKRRRWERRDFLAFPPGRALLSVVLVIENLVEPLPVEVGPPVGPADG